MCLCVCVCVCVLECGTRTHSGVATVQQVVDITQPLLRLVLDLLLHVNNVLLEILHLILVQLRQVVDLLLEPFHPEALFL